MLLSIAVVPLLAPPFFWHHHFGKVAAGLVAGLSAALRADLRSCGAAGASLVHAAAGRVHPLHHPADRAVYVVAGGIYMSAAICMARRP
jgi:hypothetical protein